MAIKILLADDSLTIQKVVELTFSDGDTRLMAVGSGDKAVQALDDFQPDLVLADVVMPGLTGYDVCEAVKKRPGGEFVPVVLLTGTFEPFDRARAERVGSDSIVTKPFDSHALQGLVRELVSKARAARADAEAAAAEAPPVPSAERPTLVLSVADLEETVAAPPAPAADTAKTQAFAAIDYTAPPAAPFAEAAAEAPHEESIYATKAMKIPTPDELRLAAEEEGIVPPPPPFPVEPLSGPPEAAASPFEEEVETGPMARPGPELPFEPPPPPPPPPAFYEPEPAFVPPPPPPPPAFYEPEPPAAAAVEEAGPMPFELVEETGPDTEPVSPVIPEAPVAEPFLAAVDEEPAAAADEPTGVVEEPPTPFLVEAEAVPAEPAAEPPPVGIADEAERAAEPAPALEAVEPFPEMDEPAPAVESEAAPWDESASVEIPPPPPELSAPLDTDAPEPITRDLEQDMAAFEASGRVLRRPEIWERHAALIGEEVPTDIDLQPAAVPAEQGPAESEGPSESELEELAAASRLEDLSRLIPPASVSVPRPVEVAEAAVPVSPPEPAAPAAAGPGAGSALSEADVDRIARRVVELLSDKAVRDIAWEVVPEYAERLVRERIAEVEKAG